ncbi:MAG: S-layer homology domain-containing protein [Clostridia bacterium]|nr:S-layer homology domain-containing protein [Clostridia bacterium]
MKKILFLVLSLLMILMIFNISYAKESYKVTQTYKLTNKGTRAIKTSFATIKIGQKDFVSYEDDESVTITPTPNSKFYDDFGNLYVTYDLGTYNPGRSIDITIERVYTPGSYSGDIPNRTSSTIDADNKIYTKPATRIESDNSEIVSKAKEVTYNVTSDYKKAMALYEFVNTYLSYDNSGSYANKGAYSALINKKGVCSEYATLYAALCRAVGIPCRVISGYIVERKLVKEEDRVFDDSVGKYVDVPAEYKYSITNHDWNEIWMDDYGWLPVDTCVTYISPKGSKVTSFNSFCKIDGAEYIAVSVFNADKIDVADPNNASEKVSVNSTSIIYTDNFEKSEDVEFSLNGNARDIEHSFKDVADFPWAEDSINTLYNMGVVNGYNEDEFGPSGNITRIEFICMLARILRSLNYAPRSTGMIYYFIDYDESHYSKLDYDFLMRCLEDAYPGLGRVAVGMEGITNIFGSSLQMNKPITRGEVVALMDAFIKISDGELLPLSDISGHQFESSIIKAIKGGLIKGYDDGTFRPDNPIRRAEIAVILDRYMGIKTVDLFD